MDIAILSPFYVDFEPGTVQCTANRTTAEKNGETFKHRPFLFFGENIVNSRRGVRVLDVLYDSTCRKCCMIHYAETNKA